MGSRKPVEYVIPAMVARKSVGYGGGLEDIQINENFAKLDAALIVAVQEARESKVQRELMLNQKDTTHSTYDQNNVYDMYGGSDEQSENVTKTERFKSNKPVAERAGSASKRERPVEFDTQEDNDPFGLEQFLYDINKAKKSLNKIGGGGTMKATAESSRERIW